MVWRPSWAASFDSDVPLDDRPVVGGVQPQRSIRSPTSRNFARSAPLDVGRWRSPSQRPSLGTTGSTGAPRRLLQGAEPETDTDNVLAGRPHGPKGPVHVLRDVLVQTVPSCKPPCSPKSCSHAVTSESSRRCQNDAGLRHHDLALVVGLVEVLPCRASAPRRVGSAAGSVLIASTAKLKRTYLRWRDAPDVRAGNHVALRAFASR